MSDTHEKEQGESPVEKGLELHDLPAYKEGEGVKGGVYLNPAPSPSPSPSPTPLPSPSPTPCSTLGLSTCSGPPPTSVDTCTTDCR